MIEFDAARHLYINTSNGRIVPSASSILRKARVRDEPFVGNGSRGFAVERALKRGTEVHRLTRSLDETGDLVDAFEDYFDPAQLLPETANYVAAYDRFLRESGYVPIAWEVIVWNDLWNYAGRADGVGWLGNVRVMIDRKTDRSLHRAVWLQLALYRMAWNRRHPNEKIEKTYAVKLCDDMTYKLVPNPYEPNDEHYAVAAIWMAKWHDSVAV